MTGVTGVARPEILEDLSGFVIGSPRASEAVLAEAHRRLLDTVGVAYGGLLSDPAVAAQRFALRTRPADGAGEGAVVWGRAHRSTPQDAAFANGVAARYLDFNDAYFGRGGCHPSDAIPTIVAVGEDIGAPADDVLDAVAVAYEIAVALSDSFRVHDRGWDHVNTLQVGMAGGVARLLGLDRAATAHAISLTVVPHAAMRQTRTGQIGMWKAAAAADSGRHAIYAAALASAGMEGPVEPFAGRSAFFALLLGDADVDLAPIERLRELDAPSALLRTHIKRWPLGYVAQSAVASAIRLSAEVEDLEQVERITVRTYEMAIWRMVSPEKLVPATRETADHSLPYVTSVALRDGNVTPDSFRVEDFTDPRMHAFLQERFVVEVDPELDRRYPEEFPAVVEVLLRSGEVLIDRTDCPPGHARNPLSDAELEMKFRETACVTLAPDRLEAMFEALKAYRTPRGPHRLRDELERPVGPQALRGS